jgi:opacity protein-like surface antigen
MRSLIGVALLVVATAQSVAAQAPNASAAAQTPNVPAAAPAADPLASPVVLGRFGYFLASEPAFKDIYGNGPVYGGEARFALKPGSRRFVIWAEGSYRSRTGQLSFTNEATTVAVTAVEFGVHYRILPGNVSPYVGAGAGYYHLNERSEALGTATQGKAGFCGTAGVSVVMATRLVLDARVKYSTAHMQPAAFNVDVGGLTAGGGIGIRF